MQGWILGENEGKEFAMGCRVRFGIDCTIFQDVPGPFSMPVYFITTEKIFYSRNFRNDVLKFRF